jgi:polyisoprenoid-binding protein YceI
MARWFFEPGHTAAEFRARHMMVTWVRGHFKNIAGTLEFDHRQPERSSVEVSIAADTIWTGVSERDAHLRSADFLDVEQHPTIDFRGAEVRVGGENEFAVTGELRIRGVTKPATLEVRYLGQWQCPWWEGSVNKGPVIRAGFVAKTVVNRHEFGVSWNETIDKGGVVVGDHVYITIDVQAVLEATDLR